MTKKQKQGIAAITAVAIVAAFCPSVQAMHIMEGYLAPKYCIAWGILCIPFLVAGFLSMKKSFPVTGKISR